jgi:hypothetical protein
VRQQRALGVVGVTLALWVLHRSVSNPLWVDMGIGSTYLGRLNVTLLQDLLDNVVLVLGAEFVL